MNTSRKNREFLQVQITEEQKMWLGKTSNELDVSMSHIVRRLIVERMQKEEQTEKGNSQ